MTRWICVRWRRREESEEEGQCRSEERLESEGDERRTFDLKMVPEYTESVSPTLHTACPGRGRMCCHLVVPGGRT